MISGSDSQGLSAAVGTTSPYLAFLYRCSNVLGWAVDQQLRFVSRVLGTVVWGLCVLALDDVVFLAHIPRNAIWSVTVNFTGVICDLVVRLCTVLVKSDWV